MTITATVQALLGVAESETQKIAIIDHLILSVTNKVLGYTRQAELPTALETFVIDKVIAKFNGMGQAATGGMQGQVSSVKRGDFSTGFATGEGAGVGFGGVSIEDFTKADKETLKPYCLITILAPNPSGT